MIRKTRALVLVFFVTKLACNSVELFMTCGQVLFCAMDILKMKGKTKNGMIKGMEMNQSKCIEPAAY